MTLSCKRIIVVKFKEVKTGCSMGENSKEGCDSKMVDLPVNTVVEALCYKPEGRWFEIR
jgi:hypothetical protein